MQDIEDFKCILCKECFLPPYALPYLLPCTHSICTKCLQTAIAQHDTHIICPQDLQSNSLAEIRTDTSSRRALERLVRQHKNYNQNNQLLCIQSLSKHLETLLEQQQKPRKDFLQLIDQIFHSQVQRLAMLQSRIHQELDTPFKIVKEWKENLKAYLQTLKGVSRAIISVEIQSELAYYIDQGRRIKQELTSCQNIDYQEMANSLIICSSACLSSDFTVKEWGNETKTNKGSSSQVKLTKVQKGTLTQKMSSNFSTNQSAKKRPSLKPNKESDYIKQVSQQSLESKKNTFNNDDHVLHSLKSSSSKQMSKENSALMDERPSRLRELKEEVMQELHMGGDSSLGANILAYSPSPDISLNRVHSPIIEYDELLLTEKEDRKPWSMGNYNFLEECQLGGTSHISNSIQIKKREPFNWEKENNSYVKKMSQLRAEEAFKSSVMAVNSIELINYSLQDVQMGLLLQKFDWSKIEVVKLVKTNLNDNQLNELLNFAVNGRLQTLLVSGNCLSQRALDGLLNYIQINQSLRSVYISKNCINCLKGHTRAKIGQLRQCGLNLYI